MDGMQAVVSSKDLESAAELAKSEKLQAKLHRLLREAAEVEVELSRAEGAIQGVPHYSVIESRSHELGQQLSRQVQRRQMNELAASHPPTAKCPGCGTRCELETRQRDVNSVDGSIPLQELVGECPRCRKSFFPDA